MPIFKIQRGEKNYASIPNATLRDKRLSIEARGVLSYLLTHDDTFELLSFEFLQEELGVGREKLQKIIRELKKNGYLSLVAAHNNKGNFAGQEWFVFAKSQDQNFLLEPFHRQPEKPSVGKTVSRLNRQSENPSDNIKENNKDENKSIKEEKKYTHSTAQSETEKSSVRVPDRVVKEGGVEDSTSLLNKQSSDFSKASTNGHKDNQIREPFGEFRDRLKDWWREAQGLKTLPSNTPAGADIKFLYDNSFSLSEIQKFYEFATTDPEEKAWRKSPVTISAIVKGIPGWRGKNLAKNLDLEKLPSLTEKCTNCDSRGMESIFINGAQRMTKCTHEKLKITLEKGNVIKQVSKVVSSPT